LRAFRGYFPDGFKLRALPGIPLIEISVCRIKVSLQAALKYPEKGQPGAPKMEKQGKSPRDQAKTRNHRKIEALKSTRLHVLNALNANALALGRSFLWIWKGLLRRGK